MLFVNEVFASIQGEGYFTGKPAVFIRFQGCPNKCPWCDTKYALAQLRENGRSLDDLDADATAYASCTARQLTDHVFARYPNLGFAVLTGGEPCAQDAIELLALCGCLKERDFSIQVETSGTLPVSLPEWVWVTVSPKVGMPGGLKVREDAIARANEIKMVTGGEVDLAVLDELLVHARPEARIALQPLSANEVSTAFCVKNVMERGGNYTLSIQTQKYLNIR